MLCFERIVPSGSRRQLTIQNWELKFVKILIIEDNPISRKLVRVALEAEGYAVLDAADGKTGFAVASEERPDLILQDLLLPDVNGIDLVSQLRALPGMDNIPILALTGLVAKADELRLSAAPFTDYLFKPVEPSLLVSTVRAYLTSAPDAEPTPGKNRRILVIDDEPAQRKLLATKLSQLGFAVTTAQTGQEGLAKARSEQPHAILSDVLMPGMDGFKLCIQIRKDPSLAQVPVVLFSNSYERESDQKLARGAGAYTLVRTAPDFHDVTQALLRSLEVTPAKPIDDPQTFSALHQERLARQLDRQVKLSTQLARRCAAQSAQISVLARMGADVIKGKIDARSLSSDLLARYLDAMGRSCGAIYLAGPKNDLLLAAHMGFPYPAAKSMEDFYGYSGVIQDAMKRREPMTISIAPSSNAALARMLSDLRAETLILSPLRFHDDALGVIVLVSENAAPDADWLPFSQAITSEIAQVIALNRAFSKLHFLASHDALTGLPNRARLRELLQLAIADGKCPALYLLNLHRFEEINNALSYRNGDLLLQQVAYRLRVAAGDEATVARLAADEFAVLIDDVPSQEIVQQTAKEILKSLEPSFRLVGLPVSMRASVGIAFMAGQSTDADSLLSYADVARRGAKRTGNDFLIYPANLEPYLPDHLVLLSELREAIEQDTLALHYQPKVCFKSGKTIGVEALIRWRHPERGPIPPDRFIPLAERAGLIHPVTLWVLGAALRQARRWLEIGLDMGVAINVSARDLQDEAFPDDVARACQEIGVPPENVNLELTERDLMLDPAKAEVGIQRLSATGVGLAIDDFGTGYSGLSYLHKLPVKEIKIDKSFVVGMLDDPRSAAIARSIIDLGRNLRLAVVAEGIEDQKTWDALVDLGCDVGQGYFICRPLPAEELNPWLLESPWGMVRNGNNRQPERSADSK
jgi:diguanylate cyclase (GGDEF)-like protein